MGPPINGFPITTEISQHKEIEEVSDSSDFQHYSLGIFERHSNRIRHLSCKQVHRCPNLIKHITAIDGRSSGVFKLSFRKQRFFLRSKNCNNIHIFHVADDLQRTAEKVRRGS